MQDEKDCHLNQKTISYNEAGKINQEQLMPMPQQHCFPCRIIYSAMLAITREKFTIQFITLPLVPSPVQQFLSTPLVSNGH